MAENIISAVIHVDEQHHLHCDFVPLTKRKSAKDVIGDKMRRTQRNFLKQCKKGASAKFARLERRKHNLA